MFNDIRHFIVTQSIHEIFFKSYDDLSEDICIQGPKAYPNIENYAPRVP